MSLQRLGLIIASWGIDMNFERVCEILHRCHPKGKTLGKTLNDCLVRHLETRGIDLPEAVLTKENCSVADERWPLTRLTELAPPEERERTTPRDMLGPIIIVRLRGQNHLIDGGSRVFVWHEGGDSGPHPVALVVAN